MRNFLFKTVTAITAFIITSLDWINMIVKTPVAKVGWFLMKLIDAEQVRAHEVLINTDPAELQSQQTELNLLNAATQVRDHAQETGVWTDNHSEAIEAIGNALLDLNWEEGSVHQYLKEVVESIDGLEYSDYFE